MRTTLGQAAEVRLGRQRAPRYEAGEHMVPYLRSANVQDGALALTDVKTMDFSLMEQSIFSLEPGDVLVTEGSGSRDTVGVSAVWNGEIPGTVCFQNTLIRLRPRAGVTDSRYLAWWMRHSRTSGQIAAASSGANILHIGSDGLNRLSLTLPCVEEQQRIADFLDDRVARIDQIIASRREQMELLRRHREAQLASAVFHYSDHMARCSDFAEVRLGRQRSPESAAGDYMVPYLRSANVRDGEFDLEDVKLMNFTPAEQKTFSLRFGDVLVTEGSASAEAVGAAAAWERGLAGVLCFQNTLLRLRAKAHCDPSFLAFWARASHALGAARAFASGASILHLGADGMAKMPLPRINKAAQRERSDSARHVIAWHRSVSFSLGTQISRLIEYKQSLVTAAVTGEFDVATASTRIPE